MQKLDTWQINNLIAGNTLAMEVSSTTEERRAFIVISAYILSERLHALKVSKVLNSKDKENIIFCLRRYEVEKELIENDWWITDDELTNSVFIKRIKNIPDLETELAKYLDDFSNLDVEWKCDNPI